MSWWSEQLLRGVHAPVAWCCICSCSALVLQPPSCARHACTLHTAAAGATQLVGTAKGRAVECTVNNNSKHACCSVQPLCARVLLCAATHRVPRVPRLHACASNSPRLHQQMSAWRPQEQAHKQQHQHQQQREHPLAPTTCQIAGARRRRGRTATLDCWARSIAIHICCTGSGQLALQAGSLENEAPAAIGFITLELHRPSSTAPAYRHFTDTSKTAEC